MKLVGLALLLALGGYGAGVFIGVGLVRLLSTKPDRSIEAVTTGFLFTGPLVAVLTFIAALLYLRSRQPG